MAYSVGYFTNCPQAAALVAKFSDYSLSKLPKGDRIMLMTVLSAYAYLVESGQKMSVVEAAEAFVPAEFDKTSDQMFEALSLVEGISSKDAIALIQFLIQGLAPQGGS